MIPAAISRSPVDGREASAYPSMITNVISA